MLTIDFFSKKFIISKMIVDKMFKLNNEIWGFVIFAVLAFVGAGIGALYGLSFIDVLRAIFTAMYVLFLPGYVVVRCFFDDLEDWIEKVAVSFGLSIAVVVLSVIIANLVFGIPINALTNFLIILAAMVITGIAKVITVNFQLKKKSRKPSKKKNK